MERMDAKNFRVLEYLMKSYNRAKLSLKEGWNKNKKNQDFINKILEYLVTYSHTALETPELFPD